MNPSFARAFAAGEDLSPWTESGVFESPAAGCLLYEATAATRRLLLSCGIHGDETAPIELLDRLILGIHSGALVPSAEVMFVVGNPWAIAAGKRFIEHDMNRLFDGQWGSGKSHTREGRRACELEEVSAVFAENGGDFWHLDLHTTIRASRIERFAIANVEGKEMLPADLWDLLGAGALGAVVFSPRSRGTYSADSSRLPGATSLTLELGQGRGFGENVAESTEDFERALRGWLQGEPLLPAAGSELACYEVTREILRGEEGFVLHLPAEMQNFTPLEVGQLVAEDATGKVVAEEGECVLFPNPNVAVGLRAAVLVRRRGE